MSGRISGGPSAGKGAFAQLAFGQFREGLYRYLLKKLRHAESAEDLTQEVYLRLLRTADNKFVRNPQAYVFGVAFNVLYEFRLDEHHNPVAFDSPAVERLEDVLPDPAAAPDKAQEQRGREQWLDDVMARLSPMQQAVLLMAKRQDMSHAQIAAKLGISIGTVRKHLARAVSQCRKAANE